MKGMIIYSNPMWGDNERATFCEFINEASFEVTQYAPKEVISCLKGETSKLSRTVCSEDDTYDFETGALIALMKMCGLEKSAKAYAEIFDDTAYGDALIERDKLKRLLCYAEEDVNMKIEHLKKKDEEIENLKEKNNGLYNLARKYVEEIDQKNHEIISLKSLKISNESLKKDNESFRKTCEKLKEENERLKNEMHLLMDKNNELIEKKKDLKKKLNAMYGYVDTDNAKPELPRTLDINGVTYRKGGSLKDLHKAFTIDHGFMITGWDPEKDFVSQMDKILGVCKPLTKREKMWDDIKTFTWKGASCIEVNKADVIDFLEELEKEIPLVYWPTGDKPTAMKPMFNFKFWYECDKVYFFIDDDYVTYGFDKETSRTNVQHVTYLPPMRWDLFKKGRIVVGVRRDQYNEFRDEITHQFGLTNQHKPYEDYNYSFYMYDKKTNFITTYGRSQFRQLTMINGHKVVYWEDVR